MKDHGWNPCAEFKSHRKLLDALRLYEEKAKLLADSELWKFIGAKDMKVSWHFEEQQFNESHVMPSREMLQSYILTLRFFIQNGEGISPPCMIYFYREEKVEHACREMLRVICKRMKSAFEKKCPMDFENSNLTYGDHFFGWIYGDLAHANTERFPVIQQMNQHPVSQQLGWYEFVHILALVHVNLQRLRYLNRVAFLAHGLFTP